MQEVGLVEGKHLCQLRRFGNFIGKTTPRQPNSQIANSMVIYVNSCPFLFEELYLLTSYLLHLFSKRS